MKSPCISCHWRNILTYLRGPFMIHMLVLYTLTFAVILPALCFRLKHSMYYLTPTNKAESQDLLRQENDQRIQKADYFFEMSDKIKLKTVLKQFNGNGSAIDVVISIITVSRNRQRLDQYQPKYLAQVLWKFLSLLFASQGQGYPYRIQLSVCNVDGDPDSYIEAKNMSRYVPVFNRFSKRTLNIGDVLEKEKQDYVFCLNSSFHQYKPKYVLLVEDDALPNDDFFDILQFMIKKHLGHKETHGLEQFEKPLLFVKMYHPERLIGFYSIEPERLPELFGLGALAGTVLLVIYTRIFTKESTSRSIYFIWFCFSVYSMLVACAIGRQNLVELRRLSKHLYSYVPAPSCCTPANLFPEQGGKMVVDYLSKIRCYPRFGKDTALDKMRREKNAAAFMIQPNLFKHIGMYSSLRDVILDPSIV